MTHAGKLWENVAETMWQHGYAKEGVPQRLAAEVFAAAVMLGGHRAACELDRVELVIQRFEHGIDEAFERGEL